ncbi:MAG: pectinesterase family protein [Faecousia sp.]
MHPVLFTGPSDDLQKIFDSAPENAEIHLSEGIYRCKTVLRTRGLTLTGAGADKTKLVFDDYARKPHPIGYEYNTFRTYTLAVCADGVTIRNLSVVNDALQPHIKGQEIALSVLGTGFLMEDCVLSSTQDTLFVGPLPSDLIGRYEGFLTDELRRGGFLEQRFTRCRIEGNVDFIFGCGDAEFTQCEIRSVSDVRSTGYVAAPAHDLTRRKGFTFQNCRFTCQAGVKTGSVFLARPWRDYGLARFENCTYASHIHPGGFDPWNGTRRDKTARFFETPGIPGRVPWINRSHGVGENA